ncbi:MAG TPA: CCA tRNA nucleotidyltransferase [Planctomycetota bacterium]|nr:CCA tRNA nucleotidyltransferase [Planctomycetota bacterium]
MPSREIATSVARRLFWAGHEALFAGGCVRDRLRGVAPKDFDIATSARPEEVRALFPKTLPVGVAFGVVLVIEEGEQVEVATFREDLGIADGRHPAQVRFADARADALRRDFTINGMFEDPETGRVLDYVGGEADLRARTVRAIGDPALRFREDRLRMLRAVRFATVLDFRIERATLRAVRDAAPAIAEVSAERIRDELSKILVSGRGGRGLGLLFDTGLLAAILPEVAALDGVPQPPRFHPEGDVLTHTRMLLDGVRGGGEEVALAALLHDVGKAPTLEMKQGRPAFPGHAQAGAGMAEGILRRLRYPNRVVEQVTDLVDRHMDWPQLKNMREAKRRRLLLRDDLPLHMELHRLDCAACHGDLAVHAYALEERKRLEAEPPPVRPLLTGDDLIGMGFAPGPPFKAMLEAIVDAQLEGAVRNADEARAFVRARFGGGGL